MPNVADFDLPSYDDVAKRLSEKGVDLANYYGPADPWPPPADEIKKLADQMFDDVVGSQAGD